MTIKSQQEIQNEIKMLREIKPNVRRHSAFGDDHHAAINAQIQVLTEDLDENDIFQMQDDVFWEENVIDAANEAAAWKNGELDTDSLVDDWKDVKPS